MTGSNDTLELKIAILFDKIQTGLDNEEVFQFFGDRLTEIGIDQCGLILNVGYRHRLNPRIDRSSGK